MPTLLMEPPLSDELEKFDGLWVAVSEGNGHLAVVASGKTFQAALKAAKAAGVRDPIVFHSPLRRKGRAYY